MIFWIAILPAVAVLLIAGMTGSRFLTWMAAVAGAAVDVFFGQPLLMILDLAAVAVALWVSLAGINGGPKPTISQPALVKAKPPKDNGIATLVVSTALEVVEIKCAIKAHLCFNSTHDGTQIPR
ncbi:MAG: hypothetical protein H7293_07745 [Candidatus Saccharibacteria bacterium]|nr:hypothetical protein [Rhodoferax sp.]